MFFSFHNVYIHRFWHRYMCNADPTQAFCGANGEPNPIAKDPIPNDQQLVGFPNIHYIYIIELCVYIYIHNHCFTGEHCWCMPHVSFFSDKTTLLPDIQLEMVRIHSVPGALEKSEAFVNLGKVTASVDLTHWSITVWQMIDMHAHVYIYIYIYNFMCIYTHTLYYKQ